MTDDDLDDVDSEGIEMDDDSSEDDGFALQFPSPVYSLPPFQVDDASFKATLRCIHAQRSWYRPTLIGLSNVLQLVPNARQAHALLPLDYHALADLARRLQCDTSQQLSARHAKVSAAHFDQIRCDSVIATGMLVHAPSRRLLRCWV